MLETLATVWLSLQIGEFVLGGLVLVCFIVWYLKNSN
jgi:hypothetical protein